MLKIIEESSGKHGTDRPSRQVAVYDIPDGVEMPAIKRKSVLNRLGIHKVAEFGEFYYNSRGPRSMYAAAIKRAQEFIEHKNEQGRG